MRHSRVRRILIRILCALGAFTTLFLAAAAIFVLRSPAMELAFRPTAESIRHPPETANIPNYLRDEVDTFHSYPEWYIVWSYQAKADYQQASLPSGYSYFGDIGQFWQAYSRIYSLTRNAYPFALGEHIMLVVIGSSFSLEYALKGAYEETVGRLSEWTSGYQKVSEDEYAAKVAKDYADFVHIRPFYEFSFAKELRGLWTDTPFRTTHLARTVERRAWLSIDYAFESFYCEVIELATHLTYGYEDVNTAAWIQVPEAGTLASIPSVKAAKDLGPNGTIIEIPRYQEFTTVTQKLLYRGVRMSQIAGNELIVISGTSQGSITTGSNVQLILKQSVVTAPGKTRLVFLLRVPDLQDVVASLESAGFQLEHIYDY